MEKSLAFSPFTCIIVRYEKSSKTTNPERPKRKNGFYSWTKTSWKDLAFKAVKNDFSVDFPLSIGENIIRISVYAKKPQVQVAAQGLETVVRNIGSDAKRRWRGAFLR